MFEDKNTYIINGVDQLYDKNDFGDDADIKNFIKNYEAVDS